MKSAEGLNVLQAITYSMPKVRHKRVGITPFCPPFAQLGTGELSVLHIFFL